jgi:hypothetical protein
VTEECAVKGCNRRSVHIARVSPTRVNAYAEGILQEEILERLRDGEGVPLCPDHYKWCIEIFRELAA